MLKNALKKIQCERYTVISKEQLGSFQRVISDKEVLATVLWKVASCYDEFCFQDYFENTLCFVINTMYFTMVKSEKDLRNFYDVLDVYLENDGIMTEVSFQNIFSAFDDKAFFKEVYQVICSNSSFFDDMFMNPNHMDLLTDYLVLAKKRFGNDQALYASFTDLIDSIKCSFDSKESFSWDLVRKRMKDCSHS